MAQPSRGRASSRNQEKQELQALAYTGGSQEGRAQARELQGDSVPSGSVPL